MYQRSSVSAADRADDVPTLFGHVILEYPSDSLQFPGLASLGSCSCRAVLALVRPVVPYTQALSAALSAGDVSRSGALQHSPVRPVVSPASFRRVVFRPSGSSTLLLKLEAIFHKPPNYQESTNHDNLPPMPSLAPEIID